MRLRVYAVSALALMLSGCATLPLTMAQECKAQGAPKGSPGYEDCKQRSIQQAAQAERNNWRAIGDIFSTTPGSTITLVGANPVGITMDYTRWNSEEQKAAFATAQAHCQRYGKNAQLAAQQPAASNPIDRLTVTYNCV